MLIEKIPDHYLNLIKRASLQEAQALRKMVCFSENELIRTSFELNDPIGDINNQKIDNLIHLYPTKVLVQTTEACIGHCRFCFRKNWKETVEIADFSVIKSQFALMRNYLVARPEVDELILSGGDPLSMGYKKWLLLKQNMSEAQSLRKWRWHTRLPVWSPLVIPEWWWQEWLELANLGLELVLVLHINHPTEISPELKEVVRKLKDLGIKVKAQGVLLADVNDKPGILSDLWQEEIEIGIEPYYLHHLDRAPGTSHFWVGIEKGKQVFLEEQSKIKNLDFNLKYMLELGGQNGKVEVLNLKMIKNEGGTSLLYQVVNFRGEKVQYRDDAELAKN